MLKTKITLAALALTMASAAFAEKAAPAKTVATPFGITLGNTSCNEAEKILGGKGVKRPVEDWYVKAVRPAQLYAGATTVEAYCEEGGADAVVAVALIAAKGQGNSASREAYQALASKYKRISGGPIAVVGDGKATFTDGASNVIELIVPHMSFEFTVFYRTKPVYDFMVKRSANQAADVKIKKDAAL